MNKELKSYLEVATTTDVDEFLQGKKQTKQDFQAIALVVGKAIPDWLKFMLLEFEVADLTLDFKTLDNDELSITFNSFENIENASLKMYPGLAIFDQGYIGIGEDPTGSGDPYFIKLEESDNPPVYQIYHDVSDQGDEILKHGKELVAEKLSDIFKHKFE